MKSYSKHFWTYLFIWIIFCAVFMMYANSELEPEEITRARNLGMLGAFIILGSGLLSKYYLKQSAKN